MSKGERNVNVVNRLEIKDKAGFPVGFQGIDHYDASSLFSDTVDLPTPGYLYITAAGVVNLMLINSTVALPYTFESPGLYPILVKRIYSTDTTVTTAYIVI